MAGQSFTGASATDPIYRAVFRSAVDFAIVATDRRGAIIEWNPGAEQVFGWTASEAIGRDIAFLFTEQDRAQDRPGIEMRRSLVDGRASDERWHLKKNGAAFWAAGEMMPLRDESGDHIGYLKILRDRTEQRAADLTLRETRGLNALILRSSRDCIVVLDLEGHTLFVSDGGIESMEIADVDAIIGLSWLRVWHGPDHEAALKALAEARAGGIGRFQGFCPTHKGTPKWWDVVISPLPGIEGKPERLVSVGRDITQIRDVQRRQAALLELGDHLRTTSDIERIGYFAAEILCTTLGVNRAGYGTVDPVRETIDIRVDYRAEDVPGIGGVLRFRDFGSYIDELKRGASVSVSDVTRDWRTREQVARMQEIKARSVFNLPVFEQGAFVALYFVTRPTIHEWTEDEIEFIRNVADRTRASIERLHAQAALQALNATLEQQVEQRTRERDSAWKNSQDLQVVVDSFGIFRAVNDAWTTILGYAPHELIGQNFQTFVHPDDQPSSDGALVAAISSRLPVFENRYRHKQGGWRWISWVAAPEGDLIFASGRHVTVEKEQAAALENSEARLRTIFGTSALAQGLLDVEGVVEEANATALALIDTTLEKVVGLHLWETPWFSGTPDMPGQVREAVLQAAAGRSVVQEITLLLPGSERIFDFRIRPVMNNAGEVIALVPEAFDLTERRQVEEQLRQSQKMQAIGQLTGGIAHDFNNLLTGIAGNLELLQRRLGQQRYDVLEQYLTSAQTASARAAALTHRLLAFSRRQTLDPKPTDLNRLANGMEELIRRTVGPGIDLEFALYKDVWPTLCDPNQLENALLNLCINARDAMPDGGRLTVETGNRRLDARAAQACELPPGHYVSLCVSDNGTGMSAEIIARAFDPFFTTKPMGMGTGLGLSMIYGFARQSGGQVRIYSEPSQGTMVCIYLPRYRGGHAEQEVSTEPETAPNGAGETVLVVDDEPMVRQLVTEALRELGYAALEAEDGARGLTILQSNARIDLLVTDVGLPGGMNGRQMADAARTARPDLKVLFITGYAETAVVSHGHLGPGMHVLTKPFSLETLASRINRLINSPPGN